MDWGAAHKEEGFPDPACPLVPGVWAWGWEGGSFPGCLCGANPNLAVCGGSPLKGPSSGERALHVDLNMNNLELW